MLKHFFTAAILFASLQTPAQSLQNPLYNPAAPTDANSNLAVGDKAIAVDKGGALKVVKIYARQNNLYQIGALDITEYEIKNRPDALKWYKANSVYSYFDMPAFKAKTEKYKPVVEAYLLCFSQKYNMKTETVTGRTGYPTYYIKDEAERIDQKNKLDELWAAIEPMGNLPNTYLSYSNNPMIWKMIAKDRDAYLTCLGKVENPDIKKIIDRNLRDIAAAKKMAENFTGGTTGLYDNGSFSWMYRAVSKKAREEYISKQTGWNSNADVLAKINTALDDLKTTCAPKIALLKIEPKLFQYHDAASEAVMKNYLKSPATLKVNKTGISDSDWNIEKNELGIPLYRYKRGTMLVRNTADDHAFCKGLFFVIKQEYAGGGTYASSKISEYSEELYGCQ